MALEAYDPLIPSLPGFRPQKTQPDPGFIAELGASMRDNTLVAGWHLLSRETFAPDPTFDFEARAKRSEVYPLDPEAFFNVQSEAEFASLETRVAAEARDRQIISAGGKSAVLASLMTGVIDPVNLLPAGTFYRGAKLGAIVKTVVSTSLAAGAGAAVGEGVLQMDQELRTPQESAAVVLGSMILGGVFGSVGSAVLRKEVKSVASDMVVGTNPRTVFQPMSPPSSLGAARAPDYHLSMLPVVGKLASAFGIEKVFTKLNPVGRLAVQDLSPTARSIGASLDSGGLAYEGIANVGGDVETLAKQHYGLLAKAIWEQKRLSKLGVVAKVGGLSKFNEEVVFALRRGGKSDFPEVTEYANWLRDNYFEPMRIEAQRVGMKQFQDLEADYIIKYAPRFARHSMIAAEYDQFQEILLEHFQERLTDIWTKRIIKTKGAMDADTRVADVLELDAEGIQSYRANLEKEIAALPESLPEQSRVMVERIRELREAAKGATRDEAKRMRAEANAILESNKEQLADFVKTEKKLKGQFRLLEHTARGIAGKNRRLMERITALMEMADKSRDVLVEKLNKLARGFEDLSEEARDKAIEDAVEQLQLAKERELKALEKTSGESRGGAVLSGAAKEAADSIKARILSDLEGLKPEQIDDQVFENFVEGGALTKEFAELGIKTAEDLRRIVKNSDSFRPTISQLAAYTRAKKREPGDVSWVNAPDYVPGEVFQTTTKRIKAAVDEVQLFNDAITERPGNRFQIKRWEKDTADLNEAASQSAQAALPSLQEWAAIFAEIPGVNEVGARRLLEAVKQKNPNQFLERMLAADRPEIAFQNYVQDLLDENADAVFLAEAKRAHAENADGYNAEVEAEARAIEGSARASEIETAMSRFEDADAELRALVDLDPAQVADRIKSIQSELIAQGEILAAKRRAEVDQLTAKLQNPNEAAAEARGLRNKAQQRWFALQKRAAQDNVTIDGDNLNVATAAKWFADTVASEYMGEGARLPFFNLASGDRGPELARMLDIDETRTWSNGRKFEDFLENDLGIMLRRYTRTMGPDIELYRKFGTTNPLAPDSPFMKKIEAEVQEQRDGARKKIDEEAAKRGWSEEKKAAKLEARLQEIATGREAILRDLSGVLASVRNLRGIPQHPNGALHRMGRFMLNLNATRMMGKMVLGSMSDLAAAAVRHGPLRFIKDGLLPAISDWKTLNLSLREAQIAGTALDIALHNRTTAFGDLFDEYRMGWKVERANTFLASRLGLVSGMDFWNTGIKALQANVSIAWISDAIDSVAAGKASRSQLLKLGRLGIGEPEAALLHKFLNEGSSNVGGLRLPNTEDWGKAAFARGDWHEAEQALEAKRIFRAALARDVDDTIVTPGAEVPLWMTENMIGRLIGQFRRFTFSSTSKILIAGLQSARANGRTTGSVMALSAMPFFLASGALSYYLWAMTSGEKARKEMLEADEEKWLTEAILRGAPLGVLGEVPNFSEDLFGLSFDREASNFRSNPADLLGPSIGLMNDLGTALSGAVSGDMSPGETMAVKRMLPYNNLPYLDFLVRPLFEGIAQ